jgi:ankyrin repeat protein
MTAFGCGFNRHMLAWGANSNYMDSEEGTALRRTILSDNVTAVKVLLVHGADRITRDKNGRLPSELVGDLSDTHRREILAVVENAARRRALAPPNDHARRGK